MTTHRHHAVESYDRCFTGPVTRKENRAAHGNICTTDVCACGAERKTNLNGCHTECSGWYVPETE